MHPVNMTTFATALSEYAEENTNDFDETAEILRNLSKTIARSILYSHLEQYGRRSRFDAVDDFGDLQEQLDSLYILATAWLSINYLYLLKS